MSSDDGGFESAKNSDNENIDQELLEWVNPLCLHYPLIDEMSFRSVITNINYRQTIANLFLNNQNEPIQFFIPANEDDRENLVNLITVSILSGTLWLQD